MTFTLLPAVDVADGRVVRVGDAGPEASGVERDPVEAALAFQAAGASWIHLVDLDAAHGRGSNAGQLAAVIAALDVDVELSGGIDDVASLERALATGCARVNLATSALDDPTWCERAIADHGDRLAVCLDVRVVDGPDGRSRHRLAARGGTADSGDLWETLARLDRAGGVRYVVTDVARDGMLRGPNLDLYRAVTRATPAPVIASGGIATVADLVALAEVAGLEGAIVGSALHAGRFTLAEAREALAG